MKNGYTLSGARILFVSLILGLVLARPAWGQVMAWDAQGLSGITTTFPATTVEAGMQQSVLVRGAGLTATSLSDGFASSGFVVADLAQAIAENKYKEFELQGLLDAEFSLSSLDSRMRRTGAGPTHYQWRVSVDGVTFTNVGNVTQIAPDLEGTSVTVQPQIDLSEISDLQDVPDAITVIFRVYAWGASSGAGTLAFGVGTGDDLAIGGTVAAPGGPVITHAPLGNTSSTDNRTATATITGNNLVVDGEDDNRPAIWYRVDGGSFTSDYFTSQVGDNFEFTIPGQTVGSTVDYYIAAADEDGVTTDPAGGSGEDPPGSNPPGDFHTYEIVPEPGLRTWTGLGDAVSWNDAENWDPQFVPGEGDDVLLDNSEVAVSYTVTLPSGAVSTIVATLTIQPGDPADAITLHLPSANTANPGFRVTAAGDAIHIHDGGILRNSSGASAGSGVDLTGSGATIRIEDGGRFVHNTIRTHATALVAKLSTAPGTELGVFEFDVPGSGPYTISTSGQTYGSMQLSSTDAGRTYQVNVTGAGTVRGDLIIDADFSLEAPLTVHRTLDLVSGTLTIVRPVDRPFTLASSEDRIATITNGAGTVVGDITYERLYHLEQSGWRMIGSSFSGVDFSTLRDSGFHTQGEDVEWAEFEEGDRLLYVFNATTQDWDAVSGADAPFAAGTGYIFYMFKDDADGSPVLPNRWVIEGIENAEFTHNLVFNSAVEVESFNLVSNPHAGNLDFEELTMTNVGAYYAVWDPDGVPGGGVDGYRYFNWPSQTGTAGAFIAPFQAFVVEATDENPSITFNYNMKANTDAQEVIGKQSASRPSPHVRLFLEGEGLLERETYMIFDERASSEPELFRVPRFSSLTSDHASVSFVGPNDRLLAFDGAWPTDGTTTFDLAMQTTKPGTYVLRWPTWYDIPEVWSFILVDHLAGREINMRDAGEYAFESGDAMLSKGDAVEMGRITSASLNETARFSIVVEATTTSTDPGADLPATFALHAAYPNPFNPATQVAYDVPEHTFVRVAVYDAVGRQVAVLAAHEHAAGEHQLTWNAAGMASGLYFVRMETAGRVLTRSVTLLR